MTSISNAFEESKKKNAGNSNNQINRSPLVTTPTSGPVTSKPVPANPLTSLPTSDSRTGNLPPGRVVKGPDGREYVVFSASNDLAAAFADPDTPITSKPVPVNTGPQVPQLPPFPEIKFPEFKFPELPPPPAPPDFDQIFTDKREELKQRVRTRRGRRATVHTSVLGDTTNAPVERKTLLGS